MMFACGEDSDPSQSNLGGTGGTAGSAGSGGTAGSGGAAVAKQVVEAGAGGQAGTAGGAERHWWRSIWHLPRRGVFRWTDCGCGRGYPDGGNAVFHAWPADDQAGIAEVIAAVPAEAILDDESTDDIDEGRLGLVLDTDRNYRSNGNRDRLQRQFRCLQVSHALLDWRRRWCHRIVLGL